MKDIRFRDARPAPPRPRGKWLPQGAPAPKMFKNAPPPTQKMPRGLTVYPRRPAPKCFSSALPQSKKRLPRASLI